MGTKNIELWFFAWEVGYEAGKQAAKRDRKWNPLTDVEIKNVWLQNAGNVRDVVNEYARAIETKIKEKNL